SKRKPPQIAAQQVRRHIFHTPIAACSRALPLIGLKLAQQGEEGGGEVREERYSDNWTYGMHRNSVSPIGITDQIIDKPISIQTDNVNSSALVKNVKKKINTCSPEN